MSLKVLWVPTEVYHLWRGVSWNWKPVAPCYFGKNMGKTQILVNRYSVLHWFIDSISSMKKKVSWFPLRLTLFFFYHPQQCCCRTFASHVCTCSKCDIDSSSVAGTTTEAVWGILEGVYVWQILLVWQTTGTSGAEMKMKAVMWSDL